MFWIRMMRTVIVTGWCPLLRGEVRGGGGVPEDGDGGGAIPSFEQPHQTTLMKERQTEAEGIQFPTGPTVSLGALLEEAEPAERGAGTGVPQRSWEPEDFGVDYEQFRQTLPVAATTPSSGTPPLRETAIADPHNVRTFATLTPLSPTIMGPPASSPGVDASSSQPPMVSVHEKGGSTSTAAPSGTTIPPITLPLLPDTIWYAGADLR